MALITAASIVPIVKVRLRACLLLLLGPGPAAAVLPAQLLAAPSSWPPRASMGAHETPPHPTPPHSQGAKGEYMESLRDTYTLPEGVFTEAMEKVHGRLAMLGLGGLIAVELLKGSALL
jgi:hypothetical protein